MSCAINAFFASLQGADFPAAGFFAGFVFCRDFFAAPFFAGFLTGDPFFCGIAHLHMVNRKYTEQ